MRRYYDLVDHYEYDEAIKLFTPDVDWLGLGVKLDGRERILEGLHGGLRAGTIRHMLTNVEVTGSMRTMPRRMPTTRSIARRTFATIRSRVRSTSRAQHSSSNRTTSSRGRRKAGAFQSAAARRCSSATRTSRCRSIPGANARDGWRVNEDGCEQVELRWIGT